MGNQSLRTNCDNARSSLVTFLFCYSVVSIRLSVTSNESKIGIAVRTPLCVSE